MIVQFTAVDNSSIWDIVNNTYGTVDQVVKLMKDNNFANANAYPNLGDVFNFDDELVANDSNNIQSNLSSKKFATRVYTTTNSNNPTMVKYEQANQIEFVSNADGTFTIPLSGLSGLNARIIQVEKEIKPMKDADWAYNPSSSVLTLLNGQVANNGESLFIIYAQLITS